MKSLASEPGLKILSPKKLSNFEHFVAAGKVWNMS